MGKSPQPRAVQSLPPPLCPGRPPPSRLRRAGRGGRCNFAIGHVPRSAGEEARGSAEPPRFPGAAAAAAWPLRRKVSAAAAALPPPAGCAQPGRLRTALAEPGLRSGLGERATPRVPRGAQSKELCKALPGRFPSYCLRNGDKLG